MRELASITTYRNVEVSIWSYYQELLSGAEETVDHDQQAKTKMIYSKTADSKIVTLSMRKHWFLLQVHPVFCICLPAEIEAQSCDVSSKGNGRCLFLERGREPEPVGDGHCIFKTVSTYHCCFSILHNAFFMPGPPRGSLVSEPPPQLAAPVSDHISRGVVFLEFDRILSLNHDHDSYSL